MTSRKKKKTARDVLRSKLKRLGFKKLQKSVFIYPHDCEKEINFLRMNYGIERHVIYLLVNKIDHEEKLIKSFHKAKILK